MALVATNIGEVLLAAKGVLVEEEVFTEAQCFIGLDPDDVMLNPAASPLCCLTFTQFRQREESIHAESDVGDAATMQGEMSCSLWIRVALDKEGWDEHFMTANTANVIGASELIRRVAYTLSNQTLYNSDGDTIVWRSLNYTGFRNRGKWRKDKTWRRIDVTFDLTFNQAAVENPIVFDDSSSLIVYSDSNNDPLVWSS